MPPLRVYGVLKSWPRHTVMPAALMHFDNRYCHTQCVEFLSRVSTVTRDIDITILSVRLSVRPSVRDTLVLYENGLTYRHSFFFTAR